MTDARLKAPTAKALSPTQGAAAFPSFFPWKASYTIYQAGSCRSKPECFYCSNTLSSTAAIARSSGPWAAPSQQPGRANPARDPSKHRAAFLPVYQGTTKHNETLSCPLLCLQPQLKAISWRAASPAANSFHDVQAKICKSGIFRSIFPVGKLSRVNLALDEKTSKGPFQPKLFCESTLSQNFWYGFTCISREGFHWLLTLLFLGTSCVPGLTDSSVNPSSACRIQSSSWIWSRFLIQRDRLLLGS